MVTKILLALALLTTELAHYAQAVLSVAHGSLGISVAVAAAALVALAVYRLLLWPHLLSPLRHLPGPRSASWWAGEFLKNARQPSGQPHRDVYIHIPNAGLVRYLGLWNRERLMPTDARTLQQVLTTDAYDVWRKPPLVSAFLAAVLGSRGLLFAEGAVHRVQRRIITPAFARRQVRLLVPIFWQHALLLAQNVRAEAEAGAEAGTGLSGEDGMAGGGLVDISKWASLATLDIIGAAGLGCDFGTMASASASASVSVSVSAPAPALAPASASASESSGPDSTRIGSELARAYNTLFAQTPAANALRLAEMVLPRWLIQLLPMRRMREVRAANRVLVGACRELIAAKRGALARGDVKDDHKDILSILIRSGEYDNAEGAETIRDQLMTFLAAGHETTATLLVWAIHLLSMYPHHQMQLRDELRAAFPAGLPPPDGMTYERLDGLRRLHYFCEEVIRFYPPVAAIPRENVRDTILAGHFVPRGTTVLIVPWALHHDPKIWGPDAHQFRPERWAEAGSGGAMESNYHLLTFLAGPRSCIAGGQGGFARLEFKALVAALVGQLHFETVVGEAIEIQGGLTSRPKGGLKVRARAVGSW